MFPKRYEITELGIMHPEEVPALELRPGQVGFVACNMKDSSEGQDRKQQAKVDEFIDGTQDLIESAVAPLFADKTPERRAQWWAEHGSPASMKV